MQWAHKLRRSGYTATFCHQVISAALRKWNRMCSEAERGVRPIHRPREWRRKDRKLAKVEKKSNWHQSKPGQVSAPLILDPVPGDMLEKMKTLCEQFQERHGIKVVICPRAGSSVRTDAKPDPLRKLGCNREECLPCKSADKSGGDCEKNSVTYKITCQTCLQAGRITTYEGETGRNAFTRGIEHQQGLRQKSEKSALWKHCVLEHSSQEAEFSMQVIMSHTSCLGRQVHEAVRITRTEAEIILNSKSEFHQAPLVRVVATTGLQEEQTSAASQGVGTGASTSQAGRSVTRGRGRGRGGGGPGGPGRARRRVGRGD